jgi:hypothetical protein
MAFTIAKRKQYAYMILDEIAGVNSDKQAYEKQREKNINDWVTGEDAKQREMFQGDVEFYNNGIYELTHIDNYVPNDNGGQRFLDLQNVPLKQRVTMNWELPDESFPITQDVPVINALMPYYSNVGQYGNSTRSNKYHNPSELFENTEVTYTGDGDGAIPKLIFDKGGSELEFVKYDPNEEYDGDLVFNGERHYVINNIMKLTKAIRDIYSIYVYGNQILNTGINYRNIYTTANGFPSIPEPFIQISPGYRGNLIKQSLIFSKVAKQRYYNWSWWFGWYNGSLIYWVDSTLYPRVLQPLLDKNNTYTICGTTDINNNLKSWSVCRLFGSNESSSLQDHYKYHYDYWPYGNTYNYNNNYYNSYYRYWDHSPRVTQTYDYTSNTYNFTIDRVRSVAEGPLNSDNRVYPFIYFNNSLQIMCDVFNELKREYITCVEGIRGESEKISIDNMVLQNSILDYADTIIKWKNEPIKTFADINWFYNQINDMWYWFHLRSDTLRESMESNDDYKAELKQIVNNRLNKDDGTFWTWYKAACTTDLIYTNYLKHRFKIKFVLKRLAVYEFAKDIEPDPEIGSQYLYIKPIHDFYNMLDKKPELFIGLKVHIMDASHMETECNILSISQEEIDDYGDINNDGKIDISEDGKIETKKIAVYRVYLDKVITGYTKDDGGILCFDL